MRLVKNPEIQKPDKSHPMLNIYKNMPFCYFHWLYWLSKENVQNMQNIVKKIDLQWISSHQKCDGGCKNETLARKLQKKGQPVPCNSFTMIDVMKYTFRTFVGTSGIVESFGRSIAGEVSIGERQGRVCHLLLHFLNLLPHEFLLKICPHRHGAGWKLFL